MPSAKKQEKLERAIIIREQVLAAGREHGNWEQVDCGAGLKLDIWKVASPSGWEALITTRFTGLPETLKVDSYEAALFVQQNPAPEVADMTVDLWDAPGRKVLSIDTQDSEHRLNTMTPGPWEALFGLPAVPWPPSVHRRLAKAQSKARAAKAPVSKGATNGQTCGFVASNHLN